MALIPFFYFQNPSMKLKHIEKRLYRSIAQSVARLTSDLERCGYEVHSGKVVSEIINVTNRAII